MEQYINENIYTIDLGEINTATEVIFQLSSILDSEEVRNKRICLKLGQVNLNQAQLLSIKSLINGIDSTLSTIDTKSIETEKVAISLGMIVSNVSSENTTNVIPAMPYKSAEELKNENIEEEPKELWGLKPSEESVINENNNDTIQETPEYQENSTNKPFVSDEFSIYEQVAKEINNFEEKDSSILNNIEGNNNKSEEIHTPESSSEIYQSDEKKEEVQDELDVIFGSNPQNKIFQMGVNKEIYEQKEELTDIIVPEIEYTKEDLELEAFPTKCIKQTIRSGQVINYEGNVLIIGDCHPGSEITAMGDITVWGILSGIAHAGSGGNEKARVRALKMNAIQLRIANCYSRRPDALNTVYIEKTNSYTPEEARIVNGEIVVFKIND